MDITKDQIEILGAKGISDVQIAKTLGVKYHTVQTITTNYWKRKMNQKHGN